MIGAALATLLVLGGAPVEVSAAPMAGGAVTLGDDDGRYDERPSAQVVIGPFEIDRREVSHRRFADFVAASGYGPTGPWRRDERPELPVRWVTWGDANAFCAHHGGRLPTEAEWEAVARSSTANGEPVAGRAVDDGPVSVDAVGDTREGGVKHITGNVREWVSDWYDRYAWRRLAEGETPMNPTGPEDGARPEPRFVEADAVAGNERSTRKVVRGASWVARGPEALRPSRRDALNPHHWYPDVGFRCVWSTRSAAGRLP